MKKLFFWVFLLSGCGYQFTGVNSDGETLSVPYVEGDRDGLFTHELICQLTSSGRFRYLQKGGNIDLRVKLLKMDSEQIGYRRDREKDGSLKKSIMPAEGRSKIKAEVAIVEAEDDKVLWGPTIVTADVDYDYVDQDSLQDLSFINKAGSRETVLFFSLGQLESRDSARDTALKLLYHKLAIKIIEVITAESW